MRLWYLPYPAILSIRHPTYPAILIYTYYFAETMDPTRRDLEKEGYVENIIYEAGDDGSPSMYLNNGEEGEADGSGDNSAGDGEPDNDSSEGEDNGEVYIHLYDH